MTGSKLIHLSKKGPLEYLGLHTRRVDRRLHTSKYEESSDKKVKLVIYNLYVCGYMYDMLI